MSEEWAEREAAVSSEGPGEAGDRRNDTKTANEANNNDAALHSGGGSSRPGCIVEDLYDGVAGAGAQNGLNVSDAKEKDEDEGEC
jgi:hypothetical protein